MLYLLLYLKQPHAHTKSLKDNFYITTVVENASAICRVTAWQIYSAHLGHQ